MATITPGERVTRTVLGPPTDRAPFGVGLGWHPWGATLERWRKETGRPDLHPRTELGYDPSWTTPEVEMGIWPKFEEVILEETAEFVVMRSARGVTMRNRRDLGSMPEFLDYPVKTSADWERLKSERLQYDSSRAARVDWEAFGRETAESGAAVQVGSYPYGVFGTPRDFLGAEEFLVAFYTEPEMVREMMEHLTTLWLAVWEDVARRVRIDHIHIWEDMSGRQGSLISPAMVEEFMMPQYDRIAEFARRRCVACVSVDTDGRVDELVPLMTRHGVNLILPFEVQAGNDILDYRRKYPDLAILGGLDKRALAQGREAIDREVARAREMLRHGRYIPGFDHLIPPDVPWENFRYAALKLRDVCFGG